MEGGRGGEGAGKAGGARTGSESAARDLPVVTDFADKGSKHRARAERTQAPSSPRSGRNTGERDATSPLESLPGYKRHEMRRSPEINTQNYTFTVKYNGSHQQVVPENRCGKAEGGKASFIFCLCLAFTSGPCIREGRAQMRCSWFFLNESSASRTNRPRERW